MTRKKTPKRKRPVRRRSWVWRLILWPVRAVAGLALIATLWVAAYRVIDPPGGVYMAAEAFRLGGASYDWRDLSEMSPHLPRAVMAAEDARFCDHHGFDFEAIRAALKANEAGGRTYGASTITQQVAKNVFLWHQRSWLRKGLEAGFTLLIEALWPKRRIIEIYLNTAEFDAGIFGVEAASRHHFGTSAAKLSLNRSARLAAVLPNPKGRDPARLSAGLRKRVGRIAAGAQTLDRSGRDRCLAP